MSLTTDRADILGLATQLRPILLEDRWAELKRLGFPGGAAGEMVATSFGHPMPVDDTGNAGDGMDRQIAGAERSYREALAEARKNLAMATAIEKGWLVEVHVATKRERQLASDTGPDCLTCDRPIAYTPADRPRRGMCFECWQMWKYHGCPEISVIRRMREEARAS